MSELKRTFEERVELELKALRGQVQELSRATAGAAAFCAISTGSLLAVISATPTPVPSAGFTFQRPGVYQLTGTIDCETTVVAAGNFILGSVAVSAGTYLGGSAVALIVCGMGVLQRYTSSQVWYVRIPTAGITAQLQVQKGAAGGTANVYFPHSMITAVRVGPA